MDVNTPGGVNDMKVSVVTKARITTDPLVNKTKPTPELIKPLKLRSRLPGQ